MKSQRRAVLKGMLASAAGVAGAGLLSRASAATGANMKAPTTHEANGIVKIQTIPAYSANTKYGNLVFISGAGCHEGPNDIKHHTTVVMAALKKAIEDAGSSMDKVLKCYAYIDDIANYDGMNKVYDKAWKKGKAPARTCVAVAKGGIPGASLCEVDAICYI